MMIVDEATRVVRGVADTTTTVAGAVGGGVIGGVTGGIRGTAEASETEFVRVVPRRRRRFSRWRPWVRRDWWNGRCSWQSAARPGTPRMGSQERSAGSPGQGGWPHEQAGTGKEGIERKLPQGGRPVTGSNSQFFAHSIHSLMFSAMARRAVSVATLPPRLALSGLALVGGSTIPRTAVSDVALRTGTLALAGVG